MEKLIELLNEYEKENKKSEYSQWRDLLGGRPQYLRCDTVESELLIISKGYHFIKWLVENEKIEFAPKTKEFRLQIELDNGSYGELGGADRILMLLSISEHPIEDLISYLK